ncbi:Holliday junction resolvase RuvX [Williamsia sp. CHRR-6]|uniref:Holliday junction resolvase RuvX n=1 Tax=Williamsia sp. CHRR-6 TaxID=2835871 RepID=UPI001BD9A33D|nr:Holliday junction resolvase RuvX [Williamsia sp. CHRR-6]MBT0567999.1 Holliday junction resolvase RuvX [Williamsia sp. CHRR-6]
MNPADARSSNAPPPERGRRIAVDVGSVRIGVASCDPDGVLATPLETVARTADGRDADRIAALVDEYEAVEVIVGLPTTLRGEHGRAADAVEAFVAVLAPRIDPVPITLHDERLTTTVATQMLRAGGRSAKKQRAVIDQAAAVAILQSWLDLRATRRAASARQLGD